MTRNKSRCDCCGLATLLEAPPGTYEICPVCGWEHDFDRSATPDEVAGANDVSLTEARENYRRKGYASARVSTLVRRPTEGELG